MSDSIRWDQSLLRLRDNRISGATDLAREAIDLALAWIEAGRDPAALALQLDAMHPAIATVRNVGRLLTEGAGELYARLKDLRQSLVEGNQVIAENLRPLIPPGSGVITLSNSSTARDALIGLPVGRVYVMESLPGGEGKQMAEALRKGLGRSAEVQLIPDAAMGNVVPRVDCALVGIDSCDDTGAILHKVGTLPLALCCHRYGKPLYAAGHSLKHTATVKQDLPDADNPLQAQRFDRTPPELITRLVTELRREDVARPGMAKEAGLDME